MKESMLFNSSNICVSSSQFIIDGRSHAIVNISSATIGVEEATKGTGFFIALIGTLVLFGTEFTYSGGIILLVGILSFLVAKDRYSVVLRTSSGEGEVLFSQDKIYIEKIVSALNEAIDGRG